MRFLELAKTFENIEATRKRGEISANLAQAVKRADPEEAKIIAYLIQGRLGPPYATPDLDINERRLAEAIGQVAGKKTEKVWSLYKDVGDFGIVAEKLLSDLIGGQMTQPQKKKLWICIRQALGIAEQNFILAPPELPLLQNAFTLPGAKTTTDERQPGYKHSLQSSRCTFISPRTVPSLCRKVLPLLTSW